LLCEINLKTVLNNPIGAPLRNQHNLNNQLNNYKLKTHERHYYLLKIDEDDRGYHSSELGNALSLYPKFDLLQF
jgi:hypothetical protein